MTTYSIDAFGTLLTIGFFWALYRILSRVASNSRALSAIGYAGGLFGVAMAIASIGLTAAPGAVTMSAQASKAAWDLSTFADAVSLLVTAGGIGASAVAMLRGAALPRWLGYFGLVVALPLLIGQTIRIVGGVSLDQIRQLEFFALLIWFSATSIVMVAMIRSPISGRALQ